MIKILPNQTRIIAECPETKRSVVCYQNVNKNLNPPKKYGKKLCSESDECKNNGCEFHNCNMGD